MFRPALSVLVLALLAACAAPPLPPGPVPMVPAKFHGVPEAGAAPMAIAGARMPHAFADDTALVALVNEVLANNRDLRVAAARMRQAEALADAAGAGRLPNATAQAGAARTRNPDGANGHVNKTALSLGTQAAWELDLWGRLSAGAQAAGLDAQASALDLAAARLSLDSAATGLQSDLIVLGQRLRLAQETLQVQNQLLALVRARVAAGRGTALDVARAEALVATTEGSIPALRGAACAARLSLDVLRGAPAADCARAETDPPPPMLRPRVIQLAALPNPAVLFETRPDVQAAFVRARAAGARANQAWAARWPRLNLTGQIGWSADTASGLLKSANLGTAIGAGLSWQWLDFGQRKAEERAARAGYEAAAAEAEQAQLRALQDVQTALSAEQEAGLQLAAQARVADATTRARELALQRYEAGVSDFFSLLDAERERLVAQDRLLQLGGARNLAVLAVHKAFAAGLVANR